MHIHVGIVGSGGKRGEGVGVNHGENCRLIEVCIAGASLDLDELGFAVHV